MPDPTPTPAPLSPFDQWRSLCKAVEQINMTADRWTEASARSRRAWARDALAFVKYVFEACDAEYERELTDNYNRRIAELDKEPT